jgi:hypothetical protein
VFAWQAFRLAALGLVLILVLILVLMLVLILVLLSLLLTPGIATTFFNPPLVLIREYAEDLKRGLRWRKL